MLSFRARTRMGDPSPQPPAVAVELAAAIARLAEDLALAEEPSGFIAALESDPDDLRTPAASRPPLQ